MKALLLLCALLCTLSGCQRHNALFLGDDWDEVWANNKENLGYSFDLISAYAIDGKLFVLERSGNEVGGEALFSADRELLSNNGATVIAPVSDLKQFLGLSEAELIDQYGMYHWFAAPAQFMYVTTDAYLIVVSLSAGMGDAQAVDTVSKYDLYVNSANPVDWVSTWSGTCPYPFDN